MTEETFPYEIRMAYEYEWEDAMALAWKTFLRFEAEDYEPEGVKSFENFITDNRLHRMFTMGLYHMVVAVHDKRMVGMITARGNSHISLLFVDESCHRRGIGRALIKSLCRYLEKETGTVRVTVHASPYAVGFYHRLGFRDLQPEQAADGIRYTPMELLLPTLHN